MIDRTESNVPKKSPLSLQMDLSKFTLATEEEKAQQEVMSESTTFFKDGMRKLLKYRADSDYFGGCGRTDDYPLRL